MTQHEKEIERTYIRLVITLDSIVHRLEELGENEMGVLHHHAAGRFHQATDLLRSLTHDLKQDVYWPHEAGLDT
jgi:hypothetical protein